MSTPSTYRQTRNELNAILEYICTDEFLELPEQERRAVLARMQELIIAASPKPSPKERA